MIGKSQSLKCLKTAFGMNVGSGYPDEYQNQSRNQNTLFIPGENCFFTGLVSIEVKNKIYIRGVWTLIKRVYTRVYPVYSIQYAVNGIYWILSIE